MPNTAIYEWDYPRQMLYLQTIEATATSIGSKRDEICSARNFS